MAYGTDSLTKQLANSSDRVLTSPIVLLFDMLRSATYVRVPGYHGMRRCVRNGAGCVDGGGGIHTGLTVMRKPKPAHTRQGGVGIKGGQAG